MIEERVTSESLRFVERVQRGIHTMATGKIFSGSMISEQEILPHGAAAQYIDRFQVVDLEGASEQLQTRAARAIGAKVVVGQYTFTDHDCDGHFGQELGSLVPGHLLQEFLLLTGACLLRVADASAALVALVTSGEFIIGNGGVIPGYPVTSYVWISALGPEHSHCSGEARGFISFAGNEPMTMVSRFRLIAPGDLKRLSLINSKRVAKYFERHPIEA